jgi:ribulose-phosphate 3-epimerase
MNYKYIRYKYRFFIGYVLIGVLSLVFEFIVLNFFNSIQNNQILNSLLSVIIGILFSFWCNVRYNFKISKSKRNRSLIYFLIISFLSYLIQVFFISKFQSQISYEKLRFLISGSLFWIAYIFHRKFSFKDFKKVGVAIYSNGVENIDLIYQKVNQYPDFIHIDIVDETFNKESKEVLSYKSEVIKGYWNSKFIECHIMSKNPKKWIREVIQNVNRIFIHCELNENIEELLKLIKENNCQSGIVIQNIDQLSVFEKYNGLIDSLLVLSIESPGYSGQSFKMDSLEIISKINNHKLRNQISLVVDGGVNNKNISLIKSENIVSGSYVNNSKDPIKNIMILQTSSQYESI